MKPRYNPDVSHSLFWDAGEEFPPSPDTGFGHVPWLAVILGLVLLKQLLQSHVLQLYTAISCQSTWTRYYGSSTMQPCSVVSESSASVCAGE